MKQTTSLNEKIDQILLDCQKLKDYNQAYRDLSDVNHSINQIFDRLQEYSVNDNELQALTKLCRRVNEDPIIVHIQEIHNGKKMNKEKSGSLDLLDSQNGSRSEHSTIDSLDSFSKSSNLPTPDQKASHIQFNDQMEVKLLKGQSDIWNFDDEGPEDEGTETLAESVVKKEQAPPVQVIQAQPIVEKVDPKKELEVQFDTLLAKFKEAYFDHKVDISYRTLEVLREFVQTPGREDFVSRLYAQENMNSIRDTEKTHKEMLKVLKEMDDEEGYQEEPTKKDYTIKFKKVHGGKVALKMEATIEASLLSLLRLFYEADGYKMWAPFCKESKQIKKLCKAANYIKLRWDFPPPLSSREGYMIGVGVVRLEENGSFLLLAKTVHEDKQLQERFELDLPATSKKVRLEIQYCGVELVPITEGRTKARIVALFDPKIKVIPANFMSFIVRKGSRYLLDKIISCAREIEHSDWRDLTDNREFYSWLDGLVSSYLKTNVVGK